jgi:hypothetical protein
MNYFWYLLAFLNVFSPNFEKCVIQARSAVLLLPGYPESGHTGHTSRGNFNKKAL